ncbi:ATP-grasp domain-containing protein [Opitutales bacterium]|nr:ATP-grasp domain-containing protein [Opitutales bacterium]
MGADSDKSCIGSEKVQQFSTIPPIDELNRESLLHFCKKNNVQFVVPTRDGELPFWAEHQDFLLSNQIGVMISTQSAVQICEDKYLFAKHLEKAPVRAIQTSLSSTTLPAEYDRFVAKERTGTASSSIGINLRQGELQKHSQKLKEPVFQPQINGREFSAETWIDKNNRCHGVILRWRTLVVNGESHKSITFKNSEWEEKLIATFNRIEGLRGHILAQVIVDQHDKLHLVEINPRLGGASPLALASGLHSVKWAILEFLELSNQIPLEPVFKNGLQLIKKDGYVRIQ